MYVEDVHMLMLLALQSGAFVAHPFRYRSYVVAEYSVQNIEMLLERTLQELCPFLLLNF